MSKKISEQVLSNINDNYISEALNYKCKTRSNSYKKFRNVVRIAACLGLVATLSFSSLVVTAAAGNMTAYNILYALHPETAVKLTPVNEFCEDNGVRMKVESIYVHDDSAEIYISMQDLIGNRIDGTIDLFDSYSIHSYADQSSICSFVDYNEDSKTATFLISVQQMHGKRIEGRKMTFSVAEFLSGKNEVNKELSNITLKKIPVVSKVQNEVNVRGIGGKNIEKADELSFLIPNEYQSFSPTDGVTVTGYGFIDHKLHVQVHYDDILNYDNHGYVYLKDLNGNANQSIFSVSFWDGDKKGSFEEEIFDISPEDDLSSYSMWGNFTTCRTRTTGEWKVTFPIENRK